MAKHHSTWSRILLGIAIYVLLLLLTCQSDNWKIYRSYSLAEKDENSTTISATHENGVSSPANFTKKMRNVTHSYNLNDYNIWIIHYHKTGNNVAHNILNLLVSEHLIKGKLKWSKTNKYMHLERNENIAYNTYNSSDNDHIENRNIIRSKRKWKGQQKRYHDNATKCPLLPVSNEHGTASIVTAPDLFCSIDILEEIILPTNQTKIVHMVRDPFEMALSNYFYHSQNPTPEIWVKEDYDPCDTEHYDYAFGDGPTNTTNIDPMLQTLTTISHSQIDDIESLCHAIFQNPKNSDLVNASFYDHLLNLEIYDGLRLSTSRQIIGGGGPGNHGGGDILRMTNNVMKLHLLVQRTSNTLKDIQVMTTYMTQWQVAPHATMMEVLDFLVGDRISHAAKNAIATEYQDSYEKKVSKGSSHITHNNFTHEQKKELMTKLKNDQILAPVLNEMQKLIRTTVLIHDRL